MNGLIDSVIDDPTLFRFGPQILASETGWLNKSACLTSAQDPTVRAAYELITASHGKRCIRVRLSCKDGCLPYEC